MISLILMTPAFESHGVDSLYERPGGCNNSLETMPYDQACIWPSINASPSNLFPSLHDRHVRIGFEVPFGKSQFDRDQETEWGSGTSQSRTCEFEDAARLTIMRIKAQNYQDWDQAGLRKCTFGPGLLFSIPLRHLALFSAIIPPLSASVKPTLSSC